MRYWMSQIGTLPVHHKLVKPWEYHFVDIEYLASKKALVFCQHLAEKIPFTVQDFLNSKFEIYSKASEHRAIFRVEVLARP